MKKTLVTLIETASSGIVSTGEARMRESTAGAQLAMTIANLYAEANGSDADFVAVFGNGENPKSATYVAGALADDVKARIAKMAKAKRDSILTVLKSRLSETRRLRKLGGFPQEGETIAQALKRYVKPAAKEAKPEGNTTAEKVVIAADASMDDIADALSIWVAKHGAASAGLVAKLGEFLPVTVKRQRKAV